MIHEVVTSIPFVQYAREYVAEHSLPELKTIEYSSIDNEILIRWTGAEDNAVLVFDKSTSSYAIEVVPEKVSTITVGETNLYDTPIKREEEMTNTSLDIIELYFHDKPEKIFKSITGTDSTITNARIDSEKILEITLVSQLGIHYTIKTDGVDWASISDKNCYRYHKGLMGVRTC